MRCLCAATIFSEDSGQRLRSEASATHCWQRLRSKPTDPLRGRRCLHHRDSTLQHCGLHHRNGSLYHCGRRSWHHLNRLHHRRCSHRHNRVWLQQRGYHRQQLLLFLDDGQQYRLWRGLADARRPLRLLFLFLATHASCQSSSTKRQQATQGENSEKDPKPQKVTRRVLRGGRWWWIRLRSLSHAGCRDRPRSGCRCALAHDGGTDGAGNYATGDHTTNHRAFLARPRWRRSWGHSSVTWIAREALSIRIICAAAKENVPAAASHRFASGLVIRVSLARLFAGHCGAATTTTTS